METKDTFISYCWKDEDIANKIDDYFLKRGIVFKTDKRDIDSWQSIKEFMKTIKKSDYAILIISKNYLKSPNCMYEVLELMKSDEYKDRIVSVVLDNAKIYQPSNRIAYVKYWENEYEKLQVSIKKITNQENLVPIYSDLKKYREISLNISEFLGLISDLNNPKVKNVCEEIFNRLKGKDIEIINKMGDLRGFLDVLDKCKYIETSIFPEDPYSEKRYSLEKYRVTNGIHGLNLDLSF